MECRNFTGQPIYAQIAKYLSKGEILRLSRNVGGERYVKKFDGFQHLLVLLFAVFKNYRSLREILTGVNTEARHLRHAGRRQRCRRHPGNHRRWRNGIPCAAQGRVRDEL